MLQQKIQRKILCKFQHCVRRTKQVQQGVYLNDVRKLFGIFDPTLPPPFDRISYTVCSQNLGIWGVRVEPAQSSYRLRQWYHSLKSSSLKVVSVTLFWVSPAFGAADCRCGTSATTQPRKQSQTQSQLNSLQVYKSVILILPLQIQALWLCFSKLARRSVNH